MSQLRQRKKKSDTVDESQERVNVDDSEREKKSSLSSEESLAPGSYWLTRILFLRYLSFIYFVAFIVSYNQNKELIGNNGLTPARNFLLNGECSL